jgi:hypothetical protein
MKFLILLLTLVCCCLPATSACAISEQWVSAWNEDLDYFAETLPETHPELFHTLSEKDFLTAIEKLRCRLAERSHHQIIVELAAIVASVNDGHSRLTLPMISGSDLTTGHTSTPPPADEAMIFNHYPVRFYIYSDGLYVRRIGAENAAFAGAKVLKIGQLSAQEAMAAVSRIVQRDNDLQLQHLTPSFLVIPEVLSALGIINDPAQGGFVLKTGDGEEQEIVLSPVAPGSTVDWVDAGDRESNKPLYLRYRDANFWFEHLPEQKTVYWQYNEVYDMPKESIAKFALRLTDFMAQKDVRKLVIDLRFNSGGDNSLNRSLLLALIRSPALRDPGSLFVITGRGTFSAAMMFALDLEKQTPAIFIGEG